jgi:ABC-type arginine/histidine transport system permease subunit
MVTVAGQVLAGIEYVTVSPLLHPVRTTVLSLPVMVFAYLSLKFLKDVNAGSTIVYQPTNFIRSFSVYSGSYNLSPKQKKQGFKSSFNNSYASAFLGLLLFSVAEFLLVVIFKQPEYTFLSP